LLAAILLCLAGTAQAIPMQAQQYRRALTQEAQRTWGLGAPVARFAAQVHQESGWRADAKSKYASGLAQFTPATADWIAQVYPVEFDGIAAPYSPKWALRALVIYDRHLSRSRNLECGRQAREVDHPEDVRRLRQGSQCGATPLTDLSGEQRV
jgi:soluble lytic murein transglycosylase-like protein